MQCRALLFQIFLNNNHGSAARVKSVKTKFLHTYVYMVKRGQCREIFHLKRKFSNFAIEYLRKNEKEVPETILACSYGKKRIRKSRDTVQCPLGKKLFLSLTSAPHYRVIVEDTGLDLL